MIVIALAIILCYDLRIKEFRDMRGRGEVEGGMG